MLSLRPKPVPDAPRPGRWWYAASVAVHVVALGWVIMASNRTFAIEEHVTMIPLDQMEGSPIVFPSTVHPAPAPRAERAPGTPGAGHVAPAPDTVASVVPVAAAPIAAAVVPKPDTAVHRVEPEADRGPKPQPKTSDDTSSVIGTHRLLGPSYGDGRLWSPPWLMSDGRTTMQAAEDERTNNARALAHTMADSATKARLMAFLDSMPRDSFAAPKPQAWTTKVNGKTWGMDGSWIYLGDLKIPTVLLALLPVPQGNYDQAKQAGELQRMREDILQAARRAQNQEDFNRYVKEARQRIDAERATSRSRGRPMPRDTVIKP